MPAGDRTGPTGMGPRTGRGLGFCTGYAHPGYSSPGYGGWQFAGGRFGRWGGFGYGHWGGFGRRNRHFWRTDGWLGPYNPVFPVNTADEATFLRDEARFLENSLKDVKQRLAELESITKSDVSSDDSGQS